MAGERAQRVARNEVRFREINEALRQDLGRLPDRPATVSFVCECGNPDCRDSVKLDLGAYESVRAYQRRFVVVAGHELPDLETVVDGGETYAVVEKPDDVAAIVDRGG